MKLWERGSKVLTLFFSRKTVLCSASLFCAALCWLINLVVLRVEKNSCRKHWGLLSLLLATRKSFPILLYEMWAQRILINSDALKI